MRSFTVLIIKNMNYVKQKYFFLGFRVGRQLFTARLTFARFQGQL